MAGMRVLGLAQHPRFERDHRVLNRATRLCLAVSRILLGLLVTAFVPDGPLILGIDETLKRRRGAKTVRRWHPNRTIVAVADGTATVLDLLDVCLNRPMPLVSSTRFPLHALQYEPTPPRTQGQICRTRLAGKRLPTLACLAIDPTLLWIGVTVASWYGLGGAPRRDRLCDPRTYPSNALLLSRAFTVRQTTPASSIDCLTAP